MSITGFCIAAITPYLNGIFVDFLTTSSIVKDVVGFALIVAAINLIGIGVNYHLGLIGTRITCKTSFSIMRSLVEKYENTELIATEKLDPSYISQRAISDAESISKFSINAFIALPLETSLTLGIMLFLYLISPVFFLASLLLAVLYTTAFICLKKPLRTTSFEKKEAASLFFKSISSQIGNIFDIQLGCRYEKSAAEINSAFDDYFPKITSNARFNCLSSFIDGAICTAFQAVLLAISGVLIIEGRMTVGEYVMLTAYFSLLFSYTKKFTGYFQQWQDASASMERIREIEALPKMQSGVLTPFGTEKITIKDLCFSYHEKKPASKVLDGFNCTFKKGAIYAVTGANGSGKSTLFKLLTNLYYSDESIYFDDIELNEIEKSHLLLKKISAVPQKLNAMPITIREYLASTSTTKSRPIRFCDPFEKEIIDKLDQKCTSLSGGELRKLFLWAAISRHHEVLIFDEPTTGLDGAATRDLCNYFESSRKNGIIIVMTHDEKIIKIADYVIAM